MITTAGTGIHDVVAPNALDVVRIAQNLAQSIAQCMRDNRLADVEFLSEGPIYTARGRMPSGKILMYVVTSFDVSVFGTPEDPNVLHSAQTLMAKAGYDVPSVYFRKQ